MTGSDGERPRVEEARQKYADDEPDAKTTKIDQARLSNSSSRSTSPCASLRRDELARVELL